MKTFAKIAAVIFLAGVIAVSSFVFGVSQGARLERVVIRNDVIRPLTTMLYALADDSSRDDRETTAKKIRYIAGELCTREFNSCQICEIMDGFQKLELPETKKEHDTGTAIP